MFEDRGSYFKFVSCILSLVSAQYTNLE